MTLLDLLSELGMSEEDRVKKEYLDDMWVRTMQLFHAVSGYRANHTKQTNRTTDTEDKEE